MTYYYFRFKMDCTAEKGELFYNDNYEKIKDIHSDIITPINISG